MSDFLRLRPLHAACRCGQPHARDEACSERRVLLGLMALSAIAPLAACSNETGSQAVSTEPTTGGKGVDVRPLCGRSA